MGWGGDVAMHNFVLLGGLKRNCFGGFCFTPIKFTNISHYEKWQGPISRKFQSVMVHGARGGVQFHKDFKAMIRRVQFHEYFKSEWYNDPWGLISRIFHGV